MSWIVMVRDSENRPHLLGEPEGETPIFSTASAAEKAARADYEGNAYGFLLVEWSEEPGWGDRAELRGGA